MASEQGNQFVAGRYRHRQEVHSDDMKIRVPKTIARVKLLGGAIRFDITDVMEYELPTEEQRKNLKKVFGIDVEVLEDGK